MSDLDAQSNTRANLPSDLLDARFLCGCWVSQVGAERHPPVTGKMACPFHKKGYGDKPERRLWPR